MYLEAIVVAAGCGSRIKNKISKPLINLSGRPIIIYTLKKLQAISLIKKIILVAREKDLSLMRRLILKYNLTKIKQIVIGGRERFDSVKAGLGALTKECNLVLIHDGVRPFIDKKIVIKCVKSADRFGAAIAGVAVKSTIKSINDNLAVEKTLDRKKLWEIQTPQVFKKNIILRAYKNKSEKNATDDSILVEKLGIKVKAVEGSYKNIKITTPEDLTIAEAILKNNV